MRSSLDVQVFDNSLGTMKGAKAHIYLKDDVEPKFCKPRPVPYALKDRTEQELDRLVQEGILEPVEVSEWAAPIVPTVKNDQSIRICGDYKVTVNQASKLDNYPILKADDLFATLAGGQKFTKLDLSQAYQQMLLDGESRECLTINTHKGLFCPTQLAYGVKSTPGIFQREMKKRLSNIPYTVVRIDDILISGEDDEVHLRNVAAVLQVLKDSGLRLKRSKCKFMMNQVEYLGMNINSRGMSPVQGKVQAIQEAPAPQDVSQLWSFIGMINYYQRYIPNLSSILAPLHVLLRKGSKWVWQKEQEEAFTKAKEMLSSDMLLVHYDPSKELVLSCDASPYGVGAVLSHIMPGGTEQPIAYASRTLSFAEHNYSHLDKEALAIIFGIKKFHQYCYSRSFKIKSDHKPLMGILAENKQIPAMTAARLQWWALILASYDYTLVYRPGKENGNADGLSCLPVDLDIRNGQSEAISWSGLVAENDDDPVDVMMMELDKAPVSAAEVKKWSRHDSVIGNVIDVVQKGWISQEYPAE